MMMNPLHLKLKKEVKMHPWLREFNEMVEIDDEEDIDSVSSFASDGESCDEV